MTSPIRSLLQRISASVLRWDAQRRRREQDDHYWQSALSDPRLMADITCAIARAEGPAAVQPTVVSKRPPAPARLTAGLAVGH